MTTIKDCTTCSKPSDNKEFNCPPKMADGRHFTDYRPRCALNSRANYALADPQSAHGYSMPPLNSYDFRQYMIEKGESLINMNREAAFQRNMCGPCYENPTANIGTMLPEQTMVTCDKNACSISLNDPRGLGLGREYITEEEHIFPSTFDTRRQKKEPESCCASGKEDMMYYPVNGLVMDDYGRMAVPGGGKPLHGTSRTTRK